MYKKLNNMDIEIFELFTRGLSPTHYIREVQRLANVSVRAAMLSLNKLSQNGILKAKTRGKIKEFSLTDSYLTQEYLIQAEQQKKIVFLQKNQLIKEIIEKIEKSFEGIVLIFGSYAKGIEKKNSDLDIFVAGKCDISKVRQVGRTYGIDINIKVYPNTTYQKYLGNDTLLKEVHYAHIILSGVESYVKSCFEWKRSSGV